MGNSLTLFLPRKHNTSQTNTTMDQIEHKKIPVNGINMHVADLGKGPTIIFIHGFPELWYTWRHQMTYLASHGYRAVAPDLRGYGDTTGAPTTDPTKFTSLHVVGDLVALIDAVAAPGEGKVFVVAHDWGAVMAWALCLYRPDKVKGFMCLSVPFSPRNAKYKPVDALRALYGNDYYICRFQVRNFSYFDYRPPLTCTYHYMFLIFILDH